MGEGQQRTFTTIKNEYMIWPKFQLIIDCIVAILANLFDEDFNKIYIKFDQSRQTMGFSDTLGSYKLKGYCPVRPCLLSLSAIIATLVVID